MSDTTSQGAPAPQASRVLATTCMSHGLIHVYELSIPALLVLIQAEFGANDLRMGQVATLYALLFGLGSLPAGWLVDRLGSKALLCTCLWGGSLSMIGMAIGPSLPAFALCAAVMGASLSIYHPAGTALITHSMPISGRVFALHGMAGNLGVAGASVIAGTLGAVFGWRWALGLLALLGLALGLRVLALPAPTIHEIRARPGQGRWTVFVLLLVANAFMGMVYRGVTTFLPKYFAVSLRGEHGGGTAVGGLMTTLALLVGLCGMYVAGKWIDRGRSPAVVFLLGAVCQAPFLLLTAQVAGAWALPLFMSVAFFHFFTQPAGNHMVASFTPPRLRGLGFGVYFLMTFGAGSVGASLGGWASTAFGLRAAFPVLAVALVPSALAVLGILAWSRRERRSGALS